MESVLGYNFEHNKQLAFGWLFIICPLHRTDESQKERNTELSMVEVPGLVRALAHMGHLQINFNVISSHSFYFTHKKL